MYLLNVMMADLANLERLKKGYLGGAVVATAMFGPALIPLMRVGFLWRASIPLVLWALFTGFLWWRYVRLSAQAARRSLELSQGHGTPKRAREDDLV